MIFVSINIFNNTSGGAIFNVHVREGTFPANKLKKYDKNANLKVH